MSQLFGLQHRGDGENGTFLSILMMLKPTAESLDSCLIPAPFCKTEMRILSLDRGDGSQRTFFCFENATFRERCDSIPSLKQHQHQQYDFGDCFTYISIPVPSM